MIAEALIVKNGRRRDNVGCQNDRVGTAVKPDSRSHGRESIDGDNHRRIVTEARHPCTTTVLSGDEVNMSPLFLAGLSRTFVLLSLGVRLEALRHQTLVLNSHIDPNVCHAGGSRGASPP